MSNSLSFLEFADYSSLAIMFSNWRVLYSFLYPGGCCCSSLPESKACPAVGGPKG